MSVEFASEVDMIAFELECAIDNLMAVHTTMEADGGSNWKNMCNAVFLTCISLVTIQDDLKRCIEHVYEREAKISLGRGRSHCEK